MGRVYGGVKAGFIKFDEVNLVEISQCSLSTAGLDRIGLVHTCSNYIIAKQIVLKSPDTLFPMACGYVDIFTSQIMLYFSPTIIT